MKKLLMVLLAISLAIFIMLAVGCNNTPAVTPTGVSVTTMPTKVVYTQGEFFDPAGMIVEVNYSDGSTCQVLDYVVSATSALLQTDTFVTVTWGKFAATVDITVNAPIVVTGVEINVAEEFKYQPTQSLEGKLQYRATYSNGAFGQWLPVLDDFVVSIQLDNNAALLGLEIAVDNQIYSAQVSVDMSAQVFSVENILSMPVCQTIYCVNGYVAAVAAIHNSPAVDIFIKDKKSSAIICVLGVANSSLVADNYGNYLDCCDYKVGDEVVLPVTVVTADDNFGVDQGKSFAFYQGGTLSKTAVVSTGNNVEFDKSSAVEINNQQELTSFLTPPSGENIRYQLVRLRADFNFVCYNPSTTKAIRFYFDDNISSLDQQKIVSSPVFVDCNTAYTTGQSFSQILAPYGLHGFTQSDNWAAPQQLLLDVYALYLGGDSTYHQFVLLSAEDVAVATPQPVDYKFMLPSTLEYVKGSSLNLDGAKITISWDLVADTYVDLTADMLTSTPDMTQLGTHTVVGKYNNYEFSFDVTVVEDAIQTVSINTMPNATTYGHRDRVGNVDVTGGKIDLHYASGKVETIDMTSDMLPAEDTNWNVGTVEYNCLYQGIGFVLPITFENRALTIVQFLSSETAVGTYDLTGVVIGPVNTAYRAELLLKDINTMAMFSVGDVGIIGTYEQLMLDTTIVKPGDEIILKVTKSRVEEAVAYGGRSGRVEASGGNKQIFVENLIVVSSGNLINYDFSCATTISNQQQFINFVSSNQRYWNIVKLTSNVKAVRGSSGWRVAFDIVDNASFDIGGADPIICTNNWDWYISTPITQYFSPATQNDDYANPSTATNDIYLLCVGGNRSVHSFVPLGDDWIVSATSNN